MNFGDAVIPRWRSRAGGSSRSSCSVEIAFARRAIALALSDHNAARRLQGSWVFFDRGMIDASVALQHLTGEPALAATRRSQPYHRRVFMAPPWPEIYVTDSERRHSLDAGVAEYHRLVDAYPALGYEVTILPKFSVAERAEFVLRTLAG
jgi:predicted ATPase